MRIFLAKHDHAGFTPAKHDHAEMRFLRGRVWRVKSYVFKVDFLHERTNFSTIFGVKSLLNIHVTHEVSYPNGPL
jgi:hypothetical protein